MSTDELCVKSSSMESKEKEVEEENSGTSSPVDFYSKAETYWSGVAPTVKGMLGGLKLVDKPDIRSSHAFLDRFGPSRCERALDCGAGIGRITKGLLLPRFKTVDMAEMTAKFLERADAFIGQPDIVRVGHKFNTSLHVRLCYFLHSLDLFYSEGQP